MTKSNLSMTEADVSVRGVMVRMPSLHINDCEVTVSGRWLRQASIRDEEYIKGDPAVNPKCFIDFMKTTEFPADIFTFRQRSLDGVARHPFPMWWDNVAAISITSYDFWLSSLSQETRRNIRLSAKRGVTVKAVPFTDEFVRGIRDIYNETPVRQGRRFWHFGKDVETVKRDNSTYAERSEFIGAYVGTELAGFIKMVYVNGTASIMQILCKNVHQDKKCMNALIAKAVEICHSKNVSHLIYCKYIYHKKHHDALTEFKRRNGFQMIRVPRYYVPLSLRGRIAIRLRLQLPISELLPETLIKALLACRTFYYERKCAQK